MASVSPPPCVQIRCDIDPKLMEDDEEEAILPMLDPMLSDSVGAKARVLMARGRKLSTIYSKVSAISGQSVPSECQVRPPSHAPAGINHLHLPTSMLHTFRLGMSKGQGQEAFHNLQQSLCHLWAVCALRVPGETP